ncbi:MAG: hypothetical protein Kow0060_06910 [Methylohalobius crimeensis]
MLHLIEKVWVGCPEKSGRTLRKIISTNTALLLIGLCLSLVGVSVSASPQTSFAMRYYELVKEQNNLFHRNAELANLRVAYTHAQLYFLYNDARFVYWSEQLNRQYRRLQQVDQSFLREAAENLNQLAMFYPGSDPCQVMGSNSVECQIHYGKQISDWLTHLNGEIFASQGAKEWVAGWKQRWQAAIHRMEGYSVLQRDITQLMEAHPAFSIYQDLSRQAAAKWQAILADPATAATVSEYSGQLNREIGALLSATDYSQVVQQYQTQVQALLDDDPDYRNLQSEANRITAQLEQLRQAIHDTVAYCNQLGYGDRCFDPAFNTGLQNLLPQYNGGSNDILVQAAWLAESNRSFWHAFSESDALQTLSQKYSDAVQASIAGVSASLEEAQEAYYQRLLTIPQVQDQLRGLWYQLVDLETELGFRESPR